MNKKQKIQEQICFKKTFPLDLFNKFLLDNDLTVVILTDLNNRYRAKMIGVRQPTIWNNPRGAWHLSKHMAIVSLWERMNKCDYYDINLLDERRSKNNLRAPRGAKKIVPPIMPIYFWRRSDNVCIDIIRGQNREINRASEEQEVVRVEIYKGEL